MKMPISVLTLGLWILASGALHAAPHAADEETADPGIDWQPWAPAVFEQAAEREGFVFLYLEAVWCHWCHVMQQQTFTDPSVQKLLGQHTVATRVDHDAHPALANRYRDWGWPALIFLAPDGTEIVKRAGYIAPDPFARLLRAIVADPSPEAADTAATVPVRTGDGVLPAALRDRLITRHIEAHDTTLGGLRSMQKYMDRDSVEYAMTRAAAGDAEQGLRARRTLDAAIALIDPVWGGAYQYSTRGNWQNPHFEKIMRTQAGMLRLYAMAYAQFGDPAYRDAAHAIRDYLLDFLRDPEGAFYVSQDADLVPGQKSADYFALDDADRRALGMPAIDNSRYAQHNGLAIAALTAAHAYIGDDTALTAARKAARWVLQHRQRPDGGFVHGDNAAHGPFLGDSLHMGRALLGLYEATGERQWLTHAASAADFIIAHFSRAEGGFIGAAPDDTPLQPVPDIEENIAAARWLRRLSHYTGNAGHAQGARHAMRYLATETVALSRITEAGILLADDALRSPPMHLTVVGAREAQQTQQLLRTALAVPGAHRRVELWDPADGKLPHHNINYPEFAQPAGYVCNDGRCSQPSFEPARYAQQIRRLTKAAPGAASR